MRGIKFPLIKPHISSKEINDVVKVLKSGWLTQGCYVKRLEENIKDYNKSKYACLLNSATSGLIACIKILRLAKNDEVIVPSFSFPATANSVILGGAKPIFCDIELPTFNMAPSKIEASITRHTKAIMVVHEFGLPADMDAILKIAKKYSLFVIEDAACSLGAEYKDRKVGTFGDMGIFSFHPRKIVTSGEGGCVVTNSDVFAKNIEILRNHGEYNKKFRGIGYNFRLSDIQAAVLLGQFKRIGKMISRRISLALNYNKLIKPLEDKGILRTPLGAGIYKHIYQSYVILLSKKIDRDKLKNILRQRGIEVQIGTHCIPLLDFYRKNFSISNKLYNNAYIAYKHSLALPLYHTLKNSQQEFIIGQLTNSIKKCAA